VRSENIFFFGLTYYIRSEMQHWITAGARVNKSAMKHATMVARVDKRPFEEIYEECVEMESRILIAALERGLDLRERCAEIINARAIPLTYAIGISPKIGIDFQSFADNVQKYLEKPCFNGEITYSFEQRGKDDSEIGRGFHVHIVAEMKQRSKGEVLRDSKLMWAPFADLNCIKVEMLKQAINKTQALSYITDYTSKDGHKILTQDTDTKWREQMGLSPFYTGGPVKYIGPQRSSGSPPFLVDMN